MHFEILVEDQSGEKMLKTLVPKIVGNGHTCNFHSYKGVGHIPKNLNAKSDASKRILLDRLPSLLRGYGKTYPQGSPYPAAVIVVCDLDNKCLKTFRQELCNILDACNPKPETRFCIAIEEGEAWFLGDISAIKSAYPNAKDAVLNSYVSDSICGTWEMLADAVYRGGSAKLRKLGYHKVGEEKSRWAEKITPHMDIHNNSSPSFVYFRTKLLELARVTA